LETHDNIPKDIRTQLYAEEQQSQNRKRKRHDSDSYLASNLPIIINNYIPGHSGQAVLVGPGTSVPDFLDTLTPQPPSPLSIPGLRDDAVGAYYEWYCSKVRSLD